MEISYMLVAVAVVAQFIIGAVWYSPLMFGKIWSKINGTDHLSKEELQKLEKTMTPFYALQFLLTVLVTVSFANLLVYLPDLKIYEAAFWLWSGFILPIQISGVIWGSTLKKYWVSQIAILSGMQLVGFMLMAWILSF
jgi:Protein of unknown function (DUF1761)